MAFQILSNGWGELCADCPNLPHGKRFITHDGSGSNGIMLVGESPWQQEMAKALPFQGPAGYYLNKLLRRAGIERQQCVATNAMWCLPPRLGWFQSRDAGEAINHCRPYLDDLIDRLKPRVLVALGDTAMRRLLGVSGLTERHGYVCDSPYGIPVVPTFHPSYIMQGQHKLSAAAIFALRRAAQVAINGGEWHRQSTTYLLDPSLPEFEQYLQGWQPDLPLSFDIETPNSAKLNEDDLDTDDPSYQIIRASLSWRETTGVSFPWAEPYVGLVRDLLARAEVTVGWNIFTFDRPRLEAAGTPIKGAIHDAMWAWHFLQSDLPKSLGFVAPFYSDLPAWKHLSDSEPAYYSAVDADAALRCYLGIKRDLEQQGRWQQFERHCVHTHPILHTMGSKGLVVDLARQADFKQRLEAELVEAKAKLQEQVPDSLKPRKTYKKPPADLLPELIPHEEKCDCAPETDGLDLTEPGGKVKCRKCKDTGRVMLYDKVLDFNPDSPPQVLSLIKAHGLEVPKNRKTGGDSTGAKYLERFAKKHEVFQWILECRKRADMLGTFIWPTNHEGRVTTTFGFHPSTWRKSSRNVNCFSADTEVLTTRGWVMFPNLCSDDLVAQFEPIGSFIDFAKPEAYLVKEVDEELLHITTQKQIDLLVTHDHECLIQNGYTSEWSKVPARDYPLKGHKQPQAATFKARGKLHFAEWQVALICALQADGNIRKDGYGIEFTFKKLRKIERLRWALQQAAIEFSEYARKHEQVRFYIPTRHVPDWLADKKVLGAWLLECDQETFNLFADEVWNWDGCAAKKILYSSNVKANADWVQILAALSNRRAKVRLYVNNRGVRNWQVDAAHCYNASWTTNGSIEHVKYHGPVFCVKMPRGTVVVRRNGRIAITGQCQNIPKRNDLAKEFRKMIVAAPGHLLMESDSSAIEAVLVGFAAGDPDYTRAAKLDIHSFITAKWKGTNIDMSAPDAVVRKQLKAIKQEFGDDREKAKRGGHGTNYLLSPFGLHDEYPEAFPRQRDAQAFQDFYFGAFPKVRQWQFDTLQRAHRDGYLDNHFHYRHHFFAVLAWDKDKSAWKMGDDAKRAVAFVPQSDGSAIQTEYLLDLWQDEMVRQWMRLIIHDSIVLEVPESYLDIACEKVYGVMTKPLPELNGLSIGAEVKYGPNLGEMELWEPPAKKPAATADIGKEAHNVCSNS